MRKPPITPSGYFFSENPSKNYAMHLLLDDIRAQNPSRSLDAGVGELRNYWMFPGSYVGISHNRAGHSRAAPLHTHTAGARGPSPRPPVRGESESQAGTEGRRQPIATPALRISARARSVVAGATPAHSSDSSRVSKPSRTASRAVARTQ